MRTIKELLILLREKLPEYIIKETSGSICLAIVEMWENDDITTLERYMLDEYIEQKEPNNINYNGVPGFWWPYRELAPRLEFLDKLIAEL